MTRQSLSRFLSERRELRTFMTLPFGDPGAGLEARKLWKALPPVNPPNLACCGPIPNGPGLQTATKKPAFPPKKPRSSVSMGHVTCVGFQKPLETHGHPPGGPGDGRL